MFALALMQFSSDPSDLMAMMFVPLLLGNLVLACFSGSLAQSKGYGNGCLGLVLGLLFGVLALLYYIGMPDLARTRKDREFAEYYHNQQMQQLQKLERVIEEVAFRLPDPRASVSQTVKLGEEL